MKDYVNCNIRLNQVNKEYEVYLSKYHSLKINMKMFFDMIDDKVSMFYDLNEIVICDENDNFFDDEVLLEELNLNNGVIINVY
jgi:hypothetical protein